MANPVRRLFVVVLASSALSGLAGCSQPDLNETLARLKAVDVEGNGGAQAQEHQRQGNETEGNQTLRERNLSVLAATARDLSVGRGGLAEHVVAANPELTNSKLAIDVVDALSLGREAGNAPLLDARPGVEAYLSEDQLTAARQLPDVPIMGRPIRVASPAAAPAAKPVSARPTPAPSGRFVQIGSFSSRDSAEAAWRKASNGLGGALRIAPAYQTVKTVDGRTMVRLKAGPVRSDAEAAELCRDLGINDPWCARAG